MGRKTGKRGKIEELLNGQNPGPEAPPRSKKERERREQRKCQGRATVREAMEKGGCVRVIEGEKVRRDDPIKYFLPTGVGSTS